MSKIDFTLLCVSLYFPRPHSPTRGILLQSWTWIICKILYIFPSSHICHILSYSKDGRKMNIGFLGPTFTWCQPSSGMRLSVSLAELEVSQFSRPQMNCRHRQRLGWCLTCCRDHTGKVVQVFDLYFSSFSCRFWHFLNMETHLPS